MMIVGHRWFMSDVREGNQGAVKVKGIMKVK